VPQEDFLKSNIQKNFMKIFGTGFIVRKNLVITNRHVIKKLNDVMSQERIPITQRFMQFIYPKETDKGPQICLANIIGVLEVGNPGIDAAFLEFEFNKATFEPCKPLPIIERAISVKIGQQVGVMGYAGGTGLLTDRHENIYRFGPIMHMGIISAIAPYEGRIPTHFLMDIRSDDGMSGSPVFDIESGKVLGILTKGRRNLLEIAIPIDQDGLKHWLHIIDSHKDKRGNNFLFGTVKQGMGVASTRLAKFMSILNKYSSAGTNLFPGTINIELDSDFPTPNEGTIQIAQSEIDSIEKGYNESWTLIPVKGINETNINGYILRTSQNVHGNKTAELITRDLSNNPNINISKDSRIIIFV